MRTLLILASLALPTAASAQSWLDQANSYEPATRAQERFDGMVSTWDRQYRDSVTDSRVGCIEDRTRGFNRIC